MLSYLHALILSIVEGLTEFIPVSSTGHMILVSSLLGIHDDAIETFEIFIQLGAILSVVALFPKRFLGLIPRRTSGESILSGQGLNGVHGIMCFAAACLPVFILGFLFHKKIKTLLFGPTTVACALIVGGIIMIAIERRARAPRITSLKEITLRHSFLIGLFQCLALWPGMSRSGSTIIGGMLLGIERTVAAEFSFLVAVPVMTVAVTYDLLKSAGSLSAADLPVFAFGFCAAFVISLLAVKFFLSLLKRVTLEAFGWYRIALGAVVLLTLTWG